MTEPTIRATPLLDFLALLDRLDSVVYGPEHDAGRHEALNQVRLYVMALVEPAVAA